jgi:hypothetical protein
MRPVAKLHRRPRDDLLRPSARKRRAAQNAI